MSRVKTVNLYGGLADEHGYTHNCLGNTVFGLLSSLYKNNIKLRNDIKGNNWIIYIGPISDKVAISTDDLYTPINTSEIHIVPVVEGSAVTAAIIVVGLLIGAAIAIYAMPDIPGMNGANDDQQSYFFNGSKNVIDQGGAVPIVCGICRTGTTVISSGTYAEDQESWDSQPGSGGGGYRGYQER